jgi:hypothetical protein
MEIEDDNPDFMLFKTICGLERAPTLFGRNMYFNLLILIFFTVFYLNAQCFVSCKRRKYNVGRRVHMNDTVGMLS